MAAPWAIGLMTGTVLDGNIDIAAIRSDGVEVVEFGPWTLAPYAPEVRGLIAQAMAAARDWAFEGPEPAIFGAAEEALTRAQAGAVATFLRTHGMSAREVAAIGFHGQTVLHRAPTPERRGATRQLGDGALMAAILNIDTVFDFRSADVGEGGQGAPLAASYHAALLRRLGSGPGRVVLNLGGVGNLTWWDGGEQVVAFDTGPGNAPLNDWVSGHGAGEIDRDGAIAARGRVDEERLARLLAHPYLAKAYPKSLDRNDFTAAMAEGLSLEDGAATLTAFTAGCVARAVGLLPAPCVEIVVCGGGRRNPSLMRSLSERTDATIRSADDVDWRGDSVEAECFAYLAMRHLRGLPISFPTTTGVPAPMTGGRLARAPGIPA